MVMTVIMEDAAASLQGDDRRSFDAGMLSSLLYADDTLLLATSPKKLERFLAAVQREGSKFGLQLHADKFQLLSVGCDAPVHNTDGTIISRTDGMTYLGAMVTSDGRTSQELARRIGAANTDFRALAKIWRHSSLSRARKVQIFNATVVPKLTYGLATSWLNTAERRRLNGFQCRCLRSIWGIQPAFLSRISNQTVLEKAGQQPLTSALAKQQLLLFGKAARAPASSTLRSSVFCPGSLRPATDRYVRRRGRPCLEWAVQVHKLAAQAVGSAADVATVVAQPEEIWQRLIFACSF